MPTYFDSRTQTLTPIDVVRTTLYLIQDRDDRNKYCIYGADKELLFRDPSATMGGYWWPVHPMQVISLMYDSDGNADLNPVLFPDGTLTTELLSFNQVETLLDINPLQDTPPAFQRLTLSLSQLSSPQERDRFFRDLYGGVSVVFDPEIVDIVRRPGNSE